MKIFQAHKIIIGRNYGAKVREGGEICKGGENFQSRCLFGEKSRLTA